MSIVRSVEDPLIGIAKVIDPPFNHVPTFINLRKGKSLEKASLANIELFFTKSGYLEIMLPGAFVKLCILSAQPCCNFRFG